MKRRTGLFLILIISLVGFAVPASASDEKAAVRKALDGFYTSLNAMFKGDPAPAKDVWSQSEDVAYMGADGGFQVGWEEMYIDWVKQANLKIGGKVEVTDVHINLGKEIAVTHQLVRSVDTEAESINKHASLRASSVFRKEDGKWKMIGHHVDVIPALKEEINK